MENVRELVKALGGDEAVAAALNAKSIKQIGPRSVEKWGDKDHVPYYWRPILQAVATENGKSIPPSAASWVPEAAE